MKTLSRNKFNAPSKLAGAGGVAGMRSKLAGAAAGMQSKLAGAGGGMRSKITGPRMLGPRKPGSR